MNPMSYLLGFAVLALLSFMVKELGKRLRAETAPTQRLFLILTIWLLAGCGLVVTVLTCYLAFQSIVG